MPGGAPIGVQVDVVRTSDGRKIEVAFATLVRNRADVSWSAPARSSPPRQLATLATRHAIPAVYNGREFAETGGLMDYGTKVTEVYRQLGVKGAKPADLPVVQRGNRCKRRPWNGAFLWPCATDVKYRRASGLEIATTPSSGDRGLAVCRQMGLTACVRLPELRCRLRVAELLRDPPVSLRAIG